MVERQSMYLLLLFDKRVSYKPDETAKELMTYKFHHDWHEKQVHGLEEQYKHNKAKLERTNAINAAKIKGRSSSPAKQ